MKNKNPIKKEAELRHIKLILNVVHWKIDEAARLLDMSPKILLNKIRKLKIR